MNKLSFKQNTEAKPSGNNTYQSIVNLNNKIDFSYFKETKSTIVARFLLLMVLCLSVIFSSFMTATDSVAIDTLNTNTDTHFSETQTATHIVPLIQEVEESELEEKEEILELNEEYVEEVEKKAEEEAKRKEEEAKRKEEERKKKDYTSHTAPPTTSSKGFVQYDVPLSRDWQLYTYNLCQEYGVSFEVMLGIMYAESTFRFDCVSYNGSSYGICQINQCHASYARSKGMEDFKAPANNIKLAVMFMRGHLDDQNGDYHKALICYNCGAGGAKSSFFNRGVYQSSYSKKVMNYANNLQPV